MNESEKGTNKSKESGNLEAGKSDGRGRGTEGVAGDYTDDEIDLYELLMVLARRWKLILGIFIAGVVVSAAASLFLLKPVYKSSFLIKTRIAHETTKALGDIQYINFEIKNKDYVAVSKQLNIPLKYVKAIKAIKAIKAKRIKRVSKKVLTTKSHIIRVTLIVLNKIVPSLVAKNLVHYINGTKYVRMMEVHTKANLLYQKTLLMNNIKTISSILDNLQGLSSNNASSQNPLLLYGHLNFHMRALMNKLVNTKLQIKDIDFTLKHHLYVKSWVLTKPYVPSVPFKPNKKLIVAVSGISALFFGVFLAFFLEFIKNNKSRHKAMYDDKKAGK